MLTPKYDVCQRGLETIKTIKFSDNKTGLGARANVNEVLALKKLQQELQKPAIKKFKRKKLYKRFRDNN